MCTVWMNFVLCFIEMEGLCQNYYQGSLRLVVIDMECSLREQR